MFGFKLVNEFDVCFTLRPKRFGQFLNLLDSEGVILNPILVHEFLLNVWDFTLAVFQRPASLKGILEQFLAIHRL